MQIWFIRHGMTQGNLEKRYIGKTDEELLPEEYNILKKKRQSFKEWLADIPISKMALFCSPLKRCQQTAELLFPELVPNVVDGLKECDFGEFEYKNYQELKENSDYQKWIDSNGELPFPNGESKRSFQQRCVECFVNLIKQEKEKKLLIFVVHNGTIMSLMDWFAVPKKDYFEWQVANGCGFVCEYLESLERKWDNGLNYDWNKFLQEFANKGGLLVCHSI